MPDPQPQAGAGQPRRAIILTALPVEYKTTRAHLNDLYAITRQGTVYEIGNFLGENGLWEIIIAQTGMGTETAAQATEKAIAQFKPQAAFFIGIAGGIKDVTVGDVVAVTVVYGYEYGKDGESFLPRPDVASSTHRMVQQARLEATREEWWGRIRDSCRVAPPTVVVGPIASGGKVWAKKDSDSFLFLKTHYSAAVAVDMESLGFLKAIHGHPEVEGISIRGISDLIHEKNLPDEPIRQKLASCHAAAFAFQVLDRLDLEDHPTELAKAPPIWNVPHPRNPNFTGRDKLLETLWELLTSGQATALTQAALHGLGGVGKTQLALEYAYRFAPDYDLVWWVRAEDPVTLASDYAGLAGPLNLPEKESADQGAQVAAVRRCLGQRGKWLLIFDNAGEPYDLKGYIPQSGCGHVLITSRNPAWRGVAQPLDVKVWDRAESVAFLLKRTGREKTAGEREKAAAGQLAKELGDLPLALEQAGAYIEACGCSIGHYLRLFRSRRRELLKRGQPSQDYPDTVATTWELSFQKVKEASPAAADLLNLCAFLAPDDIPKELLVEGAEYLLRSKVGLVKKTVIKLFAFCRPKYIQYYNTIYIPNYFVETLINPVSFNETLSVLRRYSLMEVGDDALAMHRLVQAVVRDRLHKKGKEQWGAAAVAMVDLAFPGGNFDVEPETWPWCGRLLPHALAAAWYVEGLGVVSASGGGVLIRSGFYFPIRAEFASANNCYAWALAILEKVLGPSHPQVGTAVNKLERVLQDLGDLAGARAHFERALNIDEAAYGPDHPKVAIRVNNLGSVLRALGELAEARAHYERVIAILEKIPNNPNLGAAINNLGLVLQVLGDLKGAKAHFERALAIDEAAHGPDHPKVAIRLNNLGLVLRAHGDLSGAKAHYKRSLGMGEATFGSNHPKVALRLNNLGHVLHDQGDLAGATAHFERALGIDEAAYGPDHPDVARDVNNLGAVLRDLGDLVGARAHFERALAIDESAYGLEHPEVATDVNNLGYVLQDLGDLAGARAHLERALAIFRQFLGEDHPTTKIVRNNLATLGFFLNE